MSILAWWLVTALVLAGLEMATGTFYLLALSVGILPGALVAWLGGDLALQLIVAAIGCLVSLGVIRHWKSRLIPLQTQRDDDRGQRVQVESWIDATHARIHYRGTQWDAELATGESNAEPTQYYYITARNGTHFTISRGTPD
ncbi:NfeD family protein [Chitinilyticum piscinae]|uniref:NfeD family protein n=1 Tax=Chitinilyticum piscinae TaxID=2866724 RepID=A0A8J7FML5_9NEIS|nr:NfeD family protein [Chitinilyticum piscinae]MBE9610335.1 NfeD family protein [Chitinilyticum piscinae]